MAKQGFKVIDSDIHVVEPKDLWLRYLEPEFVKDGPRPAEPGNGLWQTGSGSSEPSRPSGRHRHPPRADERKIQETWPA
jgi:hypothetical protein